MSPGCAARETRLKATQTNGGIRYKSAARREERVKYAKLWTETQTSKAVSPKPSVYRPMFRSDVCESPNVYENPPRYLKQTATTRQTTSVSFDYVFREITNSLIFRPVV